MTDRKLLEQALEAYEEFCEYQTMLRPIEKRDALRERLTQPEQKPVVVIKRNESGQIVMQTPDGNHFDMSKYIGAKLYTAPQKREWQGLTDDEIDAISKSIPGETDLGAAKRLFAKEIEDKLKEKNT